MPHAAAAAEEPNFKAFSHEQFVDVVRSEAAAPPVHMTGVPPSDMKKKRDKP